VDAAHIARSATRSKAKADTFAGQSRR
jgi:hypothetical protein